MSAGVNKVFLIGNLGRDPNVRQAGDALVCDFTIGCNERWRDAAGQQVERTEWVLVTAWRGLAKLAQQYLRKGMQVHVEGKIHTKTWEDEGGVRHWATEVVAVDIQMLGRRLESAPAGSSPQARDDRPPRQSAGTSEAAMPLQSNPADDLPF